MSDSLVAANCVFQEQPCVEISLPGGDRALVALFGAQVLSWVTADGIERIYLSPRARFDGSRAIRGGVPLCFPQFNQRALGQAPLPKHGFARTQTWRVSAVQEHSRWAETTLELTDSPQTQALWPHAFAAKCTITLEPDNLKIAFEVVNTDEMRFTFAFALHTYLQVDDISRCELLGLQGLDYWDSVQHRSQPTVSATQAERALRFRSEIDRVYAKAKVPLMMRDGNGSLRVEQSPSLSDVVVWNPGAAVCATLDDMPADGFENMLCVEAARINAPQVLEPGDSWRGSQSLRIMHAAFRPSDFSPL
jgi:glucose-6-phosphate 1-epimerase